MQAAHLGIGKSDPVNPEFINPPDGCGGLRSILRAQPEGLGKREKLTSGEGGLAVGGAVEVKTDAPAEQVVHEAQVAPLV